MTSIGSTWHLSVAHAGRAWEWLRSSYWFVPAVMAFASAGAAAGMLAVDRRVSAEWTTDISWLYSGDANGAREVLATVGGSMITVAGVVFSITIVVLSLASSQFGPRLVRNFLRDTGNEIVLGTFIATFIYCLLVLRAIRGDGDTPGFVPQLSVTVGVGTGLVSLAVLIYFIQHVAASIRVENVIHSASRDVHATLDHIFPERVGEAPDAVTIAAGEHARLGADPPPYVVTAHRAGYIEHLDGTGLVAIASDDDLVIELLHRPGDYVTVGQPIGRIWRAGDRGRKVGERLRDRVFIGRERTPQHDLVAAVERLTEIAARALSPSLNDPFTAINCIDELSAALCRLATLDLPGAYRYDHDGHLRLIALPVTFAEVVNAAYGPLRVYAAEQPAVLVALLEAIARIGRTTADPQVRVVLREQADAVAEQVSAGRLTAADRRRVLALHEVVGSALGS